MGRILLLMCLSACSLDSRYKHACIEDSDCDSGRVCSARLCVESCPDCFLAALQPSAARAGDTLSLEGTFADRVLVTFPGGLEVPAVTVGPHRALVLVPSGAGGGELDISTGGKQLSAQFRRIGFQPQPDSGGITYPQAGLARVAPHLVEPRSDFALVRVDHALYVVGGSGAAGPLASVERALVNGDGTVADFDKLGATLLTPRSHHRAVRLGPYVYVIGGVDAAGRPLAQVERATVDVTGVSVDFAGFPSLNVARSRPALAVIGDGLYVIGGEEASGPSSAVERAPISSDGQLGAFTVQPSLPSGRAGAVAAVTDRRLLVMAGSDGVSTLGSVVSAAIGGDGSLENFISDDNQAAGDDVRLVQLGQELLFAGDEGLSSLPLENGAPGALAPLAVTLSDARSAFELDLAGDWLQLAGGNDGQGVPRDDLEWLPLAGAALGPFTLDPTLHLNVPRGDPSAAVIGDYLYVIGGRADVSDDGPGYTSVERALIHGDGSLEQFQPASLTLRRGRAAFASAVLGGQLCVVGGEDGAKLNDAECARIHDDGSLDDFQVVGGGLLPGRSHLASLVVGPNLYLFGGIDAGGNYLANIGRTSIGSDGNLGPFLVSGLLLPYGRALPIPFAAGGYAWIAGGRNDPQGGWTLDRAPISLSGTLGDLKTLANFPPKSIEPAVRPMGVAIGRTLLLLGGQTHNPGNDNITYRDDVWSLDGSSGTVKPIGVHLATPRSSGVAVALGNYLYVIGGETAPVSVPSDSPLQTTLATVERAELR